MQKNELMAVLTGYVYFTTNEQTADAALTRLKEALEQAGINADNIDFGKCELRDSDGNTQSVFRQPYEKLKCGTKSEDLLALPFYPGDRVWVVNAQESRHYTKGFYESFEHVWLIRNNGTVPWEGRKMICMSQKEQSVKINAYTFDVPQTDPGEDAEIKMQVDPRGS